MRERNILFRRLKFYKDYWANASTEALIPDSDIKWTGCQDEYLMLREYLQTEEARNAYKKVMDKTISGVIHSIGVMFDGGDALTDEFNIDIINRDTKKSLCEDVALHEEWIGYLLENKDK